MYKLPEPAVLSLLHHVVEHMQVSTGAPTVTMQVLFPLVQFPLACLAEP